MFSLCSVNYLCFRVPIQPVSPISGPWGWCPRFGLVTIKKVIHQRKKAACPFVAHHQRYNDPVRKCARMAPGAHPHTNVAVGADLPPVAETRLRIQLPSLSALDLYSIPIGNRTGRTAVRALFAKAAKILDTDIHRLSATRGRSVVTAKTLTRGPNSLVIR
jgi:hypothetical protein